jgi:hypothetical protein
MTFDDFCVHFWPKLHHFTCACFFSPVMTERWRELLAQLSHELDLQAARLKDLELQNRQLLDP